jgi:hypothetical protein
MQNMSGVDGIEVNMAVKNTNTKARRIVSSAGITLSVDAGRIDVYGRYLAE